MSCSPGPDAAAAFMRITPQIPALVIYLDPVNMAIQLPPTPDGERVLVKFCRELAQAATRLADAIAPEATGPRHLLPEDGGGVGDVEHRR